MASCIERVIQHPEIEGKTPKFLFATMILPIFPGLNGHA